MDQLTDVILETSIEAGRHLSAEELYSSVKKRHHGIGHARIYRTLKLLAEADLVEERRCENGFTRFEYKKTGTRHDHMICTRCAAIIEFENERIETLPHAVAQEKGFMGQSHKLELYGLCAACHQQDAE